MFGSLKEKLKGALGIFAKKAESEGKQADIEPDKKGFLEKIKERVSRKETLEESKKTKNTKKLEKNLKKEKKKSVEKEFEKIVEEDKTGKKEEKQTREEPKKIVEEEKSEFEKAVEEEKKSIFAKIKDKITTIKISEDKFDDIFWDLELALMESNVAVEVIDKIKNDIKKEIVNVPIKRGNVENIVSEKLKESLKEILNVPGFDLIEKIKEKKPFVICFVGVNGTGKTTTIAKVAHLLKENGLSCVFGAGDTFRAAAIEQLEEHALKLGIRVIKHEYGSDSAAVAFDAIAHAKAKGIDAVLIDTAGRLHSNKDLMKELEKVARVSKPDLKIFVGESITGNDCVFQAKEFDSMIGIDAVILAKADVDDKGGAAISVGYVIKKPILFLGVGQNYDDLERFDSEKILKKIFE